MLKWSSAVVAHTTCLSDCADCDLDGIFLTQWNGYVVKRTETKQLEISQLSKTQLYLYSRSSFEFCWMRIFPWIKLSWHSCSMWDKLGWLNWIWQFHCEGLSPLIWQFLSEVISPLIWKDSSTCSYSFCI